MKRLSANAVSFLLTSLFCTYAEAATFAHIDGTQSFYIGQGEDYRTDSVTVTVPAHNTTPNELRITAGEYSLVFAAPRNSGAIVVDNFEFAGSFFDRDPLPFLQVSRGGRSCNAQYGRFVVHEIAYDASNNVEALALDFSAACGESSNEAGLVGQIRLNSDVPELLAAPTAAAGADRNVAENTVIKIDGTRSLPGATAVTGYQWSQLSGPGVSILQDDIGMTAILFPDVPPGGSTIELQLTVTNAAGNSDSDTVVYRVADEADPRSFVYVSTASPLVPLGREVFYANDLGDFTVTPLENSNVKRVTFRYEGFESLFMEFYVPFDGELEPGFYTNVARAPFHARKLPAQHIAADCTFGAREPGWFHIRELVFDVNREVTAFAVDFYEHCVSLVEPPVKRGAVRFNSNVPLVTSTPTAGIGFVGEVFSGSTVTLDGTRSISASEMLIWPLSRLESYAWIQTGGIPVTLNNANSAAASFTAPPVVTDELLTFELTVSDIENRSDSVSRSVVVRPTSSPRDVFVARGAARHYVLPDEGVAFTSDSSEIESGIPFPHMIRSGFSGDDFWSLDLNATPGNVISVGSYSGDVIAFSGRGRGCGSDRGSFELTRLEQDGTGTVTGLAATFEHFCGGAVGDVEFRAVGRFHINDVVDGLPPVANAGPAIQVAEGEAFTLDGTASADPDGELVRFEWQQLEGTDHGLGSIGLESNRPVVTDLIARPIGPDADQAVLTYKLTVTDDLGFRSTDTVNVTVNRATVVPVAVDDTFQTTRNSNLEFDIAANDVIGSADIVNQAILEQPFFGTLENVGGTNIRYYPDPDFVGQDSFVYSLIDAGDNYSQPAVVSITVNAPAPPPPPPVTPPSTGGGGGGGGGGSTAPLWLLFVAVSVVRNRYRMA